MNSKKVCMIILRHQSLDARIYYKEAKTLYNAGYDVHFICRLKDRAFTDMAGNPVGYPDKNGVWHYEGITFHGTPKKKGLYGKWLEYKNIVKIGLSLKADVYHCHESDIALAAAVKITQILSTSTKLIYDMHEYWPGSWMNTAPSGFKNVFRYLFSCWEKRAFNYSDYLITANTIVRGYSLVSNRYKNVEVLWNYPALSVFKETTETKKNDGSIILCHEGNLNFSRGLKEMVSLVESKEFRIKLKIVGAITGKEKEWLDSKIKNNPHLYQRVQITGWLPYQDVGNALSACDIGLILFHPTINNMLAGPPNKLFNYMRYGMPVVSVDLPETRAIISKYRCGLIIKSWDMDHIIQAIQYLINHPKETKAMGDRGKKAVLNELSWEKQANKLLAIYDELLNPKPFIK